MSKARVNGKRGFPFKYCTTNIATRNALPFRTSTRAAVLHHTGHTGSGF